MPSKKQSPKILAYKKPRAQRNQLFEYERQGFFNFPTYFLSYVYSETRNQLRKKFGGNVQKKIGSWKKD